MKIFILAEMKTIRYSRKGDLLEGQLYGYTEVLNHQDRTEKGFLKSVTF